MAKMGRFVMFGFIKTHFSNLDLWGRGDGGHDTVLGVVRLDLPPRILCERADVLRY